LPNPYLHKHMEPFILSHPSDEALKHAFQPDGEEMLFVLQGQMRFEYGNREFNLNKDDCMYFDSGAAHAVESIGEMPLKTLIVIYSGSPMGPTNLEHIKRRIVT
jgi:mannose-6-phosphate isomerase-like protein (cupin superfamily)